MGKHAILLSGITGFVGSHLAENFSKKYSVIGLVRNNSDLWRYNEIKNPNIRLINQDDEQQLSELKQFTPTVFVHAAWGGVPAGKRDDWYAQSENILLTTRLLQLAHSVGIKHFISFGSQAEYGVFSGRVNDDHPCQPVTAYGVAKLAALKVIEAFCTQHNMNWNWFRLFSIYGTRESMNWLIPSVIKNALLNKNMEMTLCEQRYDYLSGTDLSTAVEKVIENQPENGTFNLSSNRSIALRTIVEKIIDKTNTEGKFQFGALPYRPNQVMHMEGNSERFFNTFHFQPESDWDIEIQKLIAYYRPKITNE